jgi:MscS family membrane protein
MNEFLDREFFNNTLRDYFWVAGVILFVLLLNRIISKYIAILLCKVFKRGWKTFDQQKFIDLIINPLGIFLVVTVSIVAFYRLSYPPEFNFTIYRFSLQRIFLSISIAVQIIVFTWLLLRIIDFIATVLESRAQRTHDQNDNQLIVFFRDFLKVIIGIVGLMLILHFAFSYNVSSLLTGLSIVGAAIALALRESLENLIASFVIFFDKPFTTGDTVKVQGILGVVEKIGLRSTRIRSDQKTYVTVPNKQMVDSILDNHSLRTQQRNELVLQLSLDTPAALLEELAAEIKKFLAGIKEVEAYNVLFLDINVQAYSLMIEFFVPAAYLREFNSIKQQLNFFALKTIENLQLKIAGSGKEVISR